MAPPEALGEELSWGLPQPCSLLIVMPVLDLRPTLAQYDLIVTNYTCKDIFPIKVAF